MVASSDTVPSERAVVVELCHTPCQQSREILDVFLDEDVVDVVEVICVVSESVDNILENLLHTAQCLDRSGFCIMHEEQKESLKNRKDSQR